MADLPIDLGGVKAMASQVFDAVDGFLNEHSVPAWLRAPTAGILSGLIFVGLFVFAAAVQGILAVGSFFATTFLRTVGDIRQNNAKDFNEVIAASLSELLGVEISADDIPAGSGEAATIERVRVIGDKLHDLLTDEFGGLNPIDPKTGADNARKFSGFAINFSTASAFISILTEAASIGFLKEFRELGEQTAQSIGLGRLQRLALQPLIRNMIQQPYDLYLRSQLRPDRLSESQYVKAFMTGKLTEDQVRQALAEKGYPDDLIDILLKDLTNKLSVSQLTALIRYNQITLDQAIDEMAGDGWDRGKARLALVADLADRADSQVSGILADLETARLKNFIDQGQFDALVDELPLSDEEERLYRKKVADQLERPRTRVTYAQLKAAIVAGIADFDFFDQWAEDQGYGPDDALILEYEILLALQKEQNREQIKQAAAARKAAKAASATPAPTLTPKPI